MAYRMVYLRIRCIRYNSSYGKDSGWASDEDQAAFIDESRRIFQELGWTLHAGHNGVCDTVTRGNQDLYLHPMNFSGVMDEADIQPLLEQMSEAKTFNCYHLDCYQAAAPCLDNYGFNLFYAAQEITGFCLYREFLYEDTCGCFEFLDGFELLRYLKASEFGAIDWETVPGTGCRKAILREVDESTQAYREFERQLYMRALDRLGLRSAAHSA